MSSALEKLIIFIKRTGWVPILAIISYATLRLVDGISKTDYISILRFSIFWAALYFLSAVFWFSLNKDI